jgi:DNA-binding NarL/FixJ family response regulator
VKDKINIVIADDHNLFRKGMVALIEDFEFAGNIAEAENGAKLLELLAVMDQLPDIILLDLKMPVMDGITANRQIRELYPDIKVIIVTMEDDKQYILHLVNEGVHGYLLKNADPGEVETAIINVIEKGFYFPKSITDVVMQKFSSKEKTEVVFEPNFTARELEILELICKEYSAAEIAEKLNLSIRTTEGHRQSLLEKSGAKNYAGLVIRAYKYNWVSL